MPDREAGGPHETAGRLGFDADWPTPSHMMSVWSRMPTALRHRISIRMVTTDPVTNVSTYAYHAALATRDTPMFIISKILERRNADPADEIITTA